MSKQVIHGLVALRKVRVDYEDMDYKCSRPGGQLSGKFWDLFSILKGKQRGPHGQGRNYIHQSLGDEDRDSCWVDHVESHNHGMNLDLIFEMMTSLCRLLRRGVK